MIIHAGYLDSRLTVHAPPAVLASLAPLLAAPTAGAGATTGHVEVSGDLLVRGAGEAWQADGHDHALQLVLMLVNRLVLEQCVDLAVHAGVVASGGRAIAFPGESGAGKSTLVAACARDGWTYVSDEALVLTAGARARPYAKPLSLLRWSLERLQLAPPPLGLDERPVPAVELSAHTALQPVRLSHVVTLERRPGPPTLTAVPRAPVALRLLELAFNHYRDPTSALATVAGAVRGASAWHLSYADPVQAAALLTARLGEGSSASSRPGA